MLVINQKSHSRHGLVSAPYSFEVTTLGPDFFGALKQAYGFRVSVPNLYENVDHREEFAPLFVETPPDQQMLDYEPDFGMKQRVIEKLQAGEPLEGEELGYAVRNLDKQ